MPQCAIRECRRLRDPNGGELCERHQRWTAPLMQQCLEAIEAAIASEEGLDGGVGEPLLRALGHWPARAQPNGEPELTLTEARDVLAGCVTRASTPAGPHPYLFDTMTLVQARQVLGAICEAVTALPLSGGAPEGPA